MNSESKKAVSISIFSGKGGVGKTNIALNLGYALHKSGHPVMLMDCDLGLANLDVLLGLTTDKNLQALLKPETKVQDVIVPVEENGFDFLPSASGVPELIDLDEDLQSFLFSKLTPVLGDYEFLILDLGAGISPTVLRFTAMTQERILVITPEPTSLTDGYAMIKVMRTEYGVTNFHVLVNQAISSEEGRQSFERLHSACEKFLKLDIKYAGTIHTDPAVPQAVIRQTPLLKFAPKSQAGRDILSLAIKAKRIRETNQTGLSAENNNGAKSLLTGQKKMNTPEQHNENLKTRK